MARSDDVAAFHRALWRHETPGRVAALARRIDPNAPLIRPSRFDE